MVKSFKFKIDKIEIKSRSIVGVYEYRNKIIYVHFDNGSISGENKIIPQKCRLFSCFVVLDCFSEDFDKHSQAYLEYNEQTMVSDIFYPLTFTINDAVCYWQGDKFFLNTKYYEGFTVGIAKIIEIRNSELFEIGDAPVPIKNIYNDALSYTFGDYIIRMASQFVMECKSLASGNIVWKLKLTAYLYTKLEGRNNLIYFGTAGNGGRFYGVSLKNGNIIFSYNNGGTVNFLWYKNSVLLINNKNKPILLNPEDGSEIRQIDFGKFQFNSHQQMMIKGDKLYGVAHDSDAMYAVCADLTYI